MPDQKMYMLNQDPGARKDPERMIRDGELKLIKMGTEKVNGQTVTKYKIWIDGNLDLSLLWVRRDVFFPAVVLHELHPLVYGRIRALCLA